MQISEILLLYSYNYWATERILTAASKITGAQFIQPTAHCHGSLRGTLVHTLNAEWRWRLRWQTGSAPEKMCEDNFPMVETLRRRWREEEQAMGAYLAGLQEDDLYGVVSYATPRGNRQNILWHLLVHVVNHGTQHRSEAAAMLTEYGQSPSDLDLVLYVEAQASAG